MALLIIGGDSRLGNELNKISKSEGVKVYKTTRRFYHCRKEWIYLNLPDFKDFKVPFDVKIAVILGGVTSYSECESNFELAKKINCVAIPSIIEKLCVAGIFTCYISSNVVFKKDFPPKENIIVNPQKGFKYAELKAETENVLKDLATKGGWKDRLAILRISKNVSDDTAPFNEWIKSIKKGENIIALDDLFFSPITFIDSAETINEICKRRLCGFFHLSGETDLSYYDFAIQLFSYLGINADKVKKVSSYEVGLKLKYNHKITSLNMSSTIKSLDIYPVKLQRIFRYIEYIIKKNVN